MNPADLASRGSSAQNLKDYMWLTATETLKGLGVIDPPNEESLTIDPADPEIRITTCRTEVKLASGLGSFFEIHIILRRALAVLIMKAKSFKKRSRKVRKAKQNY